MTIRNLDQCFRPKSVAVVGASRRPGSVGTIVLENIVAAGFAGPIYPINQKYDRIGALRCYPNAARLPEAPDLAVIVTPPGAVPKVTRELAEIGCRAAVVITAGLDAAQKQAMLDAAQPHLMRIVGPNTIGALSPLVALNASFAHLAPRTGGLGLISQSGAVVSSIVDWAAGEGVGFSQLISLGDMADVDVGDCINWLAADRATTSILIYLESVPHPRKFMSAARAAARLKPVIAVKPGRHGEAAQAAATHTGALSGADSVVDAALRRAGVIRVPTLEQLFSAAEVTTRFRPLRTGRLGIVTNGGGAGVMAVDDVLDLEGALAKLAPDTVSALDAVLPANWSRANPVDIIGDAAPERYVAALSAVAADPGVDAVLAMNCPTALSSPLEAARAIGALATEGLVAGKPVVACWMGKRTAEPARVVLREAGIVAVDTPAAAAQAVSFLTRWSRLLARLERVPPSAGQVSGDAVRVRAILDAAAGEGRTLLTEPEAKQVLAAYGVPVPETRVAATEAEVGRLAGELLADHAAVVVKLYSKTVSHKSDVGGVVLDLRSAEAAAEAAAGIRARATAAGILDDLDGFTVQPMVRLKHAHELLVGLTTDPSFGPVMVVGAGGTSVEVVRDTATGILPLDEVLAGDMIDATRISRLLAGYRDRPAADRGAIVSAMLSLSQLAIDHPAIVAVDVNPLLVNETGAVALDARIELDPARLAEAAPNPRLAVRPYPAGWEQRVEAGGELYDTRPIRPADAALYPRFLERVTAADMRLRFLVPTVLSQQAMVRLSQLDYDRDIAFVALEAATGDLAGICRYASDPDRERAEFGVLIRSDLQGRGLGGALMERLLDYARAHGVARLEGAILRENRVMLDLAARLGFAPVTEPEVSAVTRVRLELR